jgi:hypothetical protein
MREFAEMNSLSLVPEIHRIPKDMLEVDELLDINYSEDIKLSPNDAVIPLPK